MSSFRDLFELRTRIRVGILIVELKRTMRECALAADVAATAPNGRDLVTMSLKDLAKKSESLATAVAKEPEDFENHYRDNRKRAIAYAWEIAHVIEESDERIAYEFACACLRANRGKIGQATLEGLGMRDEHGGSAYVELARRRIARMAWISGNREEALKTMRSARGRVARAQYRQWLGELAVRNGLLLAESRDFESAEATLIGGLLAGGMSKSMAQQVAAIYLYAAGRVSPSSIAELAALSTLATPKEAPRPIVLCGFGWSGSGAVADFLKGHPEVEDVFHGREIGLWTGKYGLDRLYTHFVGRGFKRRLLLEFLARHCFGHSFLADSRGIKNSGGIWARIDEPHREQFIGILAVWLTALQRWRDGSTEPLLAAFQRLSSQVLRLSARDATRCVLLSNCVPSDSIMGVRMFESPTVIVSWRNPGDAYASKAAAFPDSSLGLNGWRVQLMSRIDNYLKGKKEVADHASAWIDLAFEDFVQNEQLRREVLLLLSLPAESLSPTFDPSVSRRNIGILRPSSAKERAAWDTLAEAVEGARRQAQTIST